jgi:DNA-binding transcriptional LysR family regulator
MKLFQLQYFVTVCKHQNNISRAAEELHISQPSISNAIRELEEEFGVSLFQRINRKLFITGEGETFLAMATDLLHRSEDVISRMQDLGNRKNHIKVGIPPMIGSFLFPTIFQEFTQLYPSIQLEAFEDGSLQIMKLMENDSLDVAIITLNQSNLDHFYSVNILDTEIVFCVNRNHPLASHSMISLTELEGEPLVQLKKSSYQCQVVETSLRACGVTPHVVLYTNQLYTISSFLRKGVASAFLFREIASMMPDTVAIPLEHSIRIHIGMVWKRGRFLYSDTARFIRFVKEKNYLPHL